MAKEGLGLEITELRLGPLRGDSRNLMEMKNEKKRVFSEVTSKSNSSVTEERGERKSQVVGWPPVCTYRRKNRLSEMTKKYIKVSMDGAPILRKIDMSPHLGYDDLAEGIEKLFSTCYAVVDTLNKRENSGFVPIYEDKDGDWMLVGDVPWEMFTESCKRLRIMKRSEANSMDLQAKTLSMELHVNNRTNSLNKK